MAKIVLIKYGSRNIPIQFKSEEESESDFDAMRRAFLKVAFSDIHLKEKKNLMPIFSYFHPEFETDVELYSGCSMIDIKTVKLTYRVPYDTPEKVPVVHVTPDIAAKSLFSDVRSDDGLEQIITAVPGIDSNTPVIIGEYTYQEVNGTLELVVDTEENSVQEVFDDASCSSTSNSNPTERKNKKAMGTSPTTWKYPTKIPVWSSAVQNFIEEGKVIEHIYDIVREAAYFLQAKCPRPSSKEYEGFARTLCEAIPKLKELPGTSEINHAALTKMISARMRNDRHTEIRQKKSTSSRANIILCSRAIPAIVETIDGVPVAELVVHLTKISKDMQLIKTVQGKTVQFRREFMDNADSITDILSTYPVFKTPEIILEEHRLLHPEHFVGTELRWKVMITKLSVLYDKTNKDDPATIIEMISQLESSLHPRTALMQHACNVIKVGRSVPDRTKFNGPALWVAVMGEEILQAFIFAEKDLLCETQNKDPFNLVWTLISVYHCFNREYPKASNQFYEFLSYVLCEKVGFVGNTTYIKFKAKYLKA